MTEKDTIRCECVFSEDHSHRFYWRRMWDKDKPLAAVVMLNPCAADNLVMDTTTYLVVNNVAKLEKFGGVIIVNLFSLLTAKLNFRWNSDEDLNAPENDSYINKAALEAEIIVLAWGRGQDNNQRIADRVADVLKLLEKHKAKLRIISDGKRSGIHPLTPSVRSEWRLEPFAMPEAIGPAARKAAALAKAEGNKKAEDSGKQPASTTASRKESKGETTIPA